MHSVRNVPTFQRHPLFYHEVKDSRYCGCVGILHQNQERLTSDEVQEGAGIK
jgi:hypothetical protein